MFVSAKSGGTYQHRLPGLDLLNVGASVEDTFDYEAATPITIKALGKLPKGCTPIVLAYLGGESRLMLSRRVGMPVRTIKTWLHRSVAAAQLAN